ncbi:MAG: sigma-E processing peptidase SpoIIGA, partial [Christensenellales bacterium]
MREVYIELFLLDNGLMGLLILRVAAPFARQPLNPWMTAIACAVSAVVAALAMTDRFFLSLPVKVLLLALMTA